MKNADMPAMPLTGDAYQDLNGGPDAPGYFEPGMGLTKREHFAAMAMQGLLCHESSGYQTHEALSKNAVAFSDALLDELEKTK